jgi:hypothetical protein
VKHLFSAPLNLDLSYVLPAACFGWFLVTLILTPRRSKNLVFAIISWVVCIDIIAMLNSFATLLLQRSQEPQAVGWVFLSIPYVILFWLVGRSIQRRTILDAHNG